MSCGDFRVIPEHHCSNQRVMMEEVVPRLARVAMIIGVGAKLGIRNLRDDTIDDEARITHKWL
jgi:hypothetical protein